MKINFKRIIQCLIFNDICFLLIENESPEGKILQIILKICLKELVILKSLFLLNHLREIFLRTEKE